MLFIHTFILFSGRAPTSILTPVLLYNSFPFSSVKLKSKHHHLLHVPRKVLTFFFSAVRMVYKVLVLLAVALCCVNVVIGGCTDVGKFDASCPTSKPFCEQVGTDLTNNQCVACRTDCDCKVNEFCDNQNPWQVSIRARCVFPVANILTQDGQYTCQKFKKAGKKCLPMAASDYRDPTVDDSLKCATTSNGDPAATPKQLVINYAVSSHCLSNHHYLTRNIGSLHWAKVQNVLTRKWWMWRWELGTRKIMRMAR